MTRENNTIEYEFVNNILQNIPTGIGVFDFSEGVLEAQFINDGYYQMISANRENRTRYEGKNVVIAIHPDDRQAVLDEAQAAIREKRMVDYRIRVLSDNNKYIWVGIRANHVPINKNTERFYAVYYDINKYVRLEKYSNDVDEILSNIPGGVSLYSYRNGAIHLDFTNEGFYKLHHGSREYWSKQSDNPVDWLVEEDRHIFEEEFKKVNEGLKVQGSAIYRIIGEDGNLYWVNNQFRRAYELNGIQYYYAAFVDMDELKNAEAARDEAQRIYETAVDKVQLVIWEYDILRHRVIMGNSKHTVYDWLKCGLPEVIENVPFSITPYIEEKSVEPFVEMYKKVDAGEPFAECEIWYNLKKIAEARCMHIIYSTVYDSNGKPVKAYGIGQNITVQKQAQEEYDRLKREREETLSHVVSSFELNLSRNRYISGYSSYPTVIKKLQRQTADEHFIAAADMIISQGIKSRFLHEYNCNTLLELFRAGERFSECEYLVYTSFGGTQWIRSSLRMMLNPRTGDIECVTYSFDITKQKRNEAIIHRITSTSCDFVSILDIIDDTIQLYENFWQNNHMAVGIKIDTNTIRQQMAAAYLLPEERENFLALTETDVIIQALQDKSQYVVPYDFNDGKNVTTPIKKQIVYSWLNKDHREILILQQDVTQAYLAEQKRISILEEAKRKADAANIAKTDFLSRLSHDIRTPLNAIINMTAFAHEDIHDMGKVQEELTKIEDSSQYLLSLINDILDISKAESGKIELHPGPYGFDEYISGIRSIFEPICEKKGQKLIVQVGNFSSGKGVIVDRIRYNQITMNLLSNAIKYTPAGGTITYKSESKMLPDGRIDCGFSITDTGIGMSHQFQKRMFEPFSQEHNHPERKHYMTGTGLGLSIVKKLLDLMGGTISVDSAYDRGTRISVHIALARATREQLENSGKKEHKSFEKIVLKPLMGKVLLVEDNDLNAEIAERILQEFNLFVTRVKDGKEAVLTFKASALGEYRAILMDIQMPIMNGHAATVAIRNLSRSDAKVIPIIAMTADAFYEDVKKCMDNGMNGHVAKPIEPQELYKALAKFMK
jgi:signal transduction histidine kinase/CheY-like chemotaxis protein